MARAALRTTDSNTVEELVDRSGIIAASLPAENAVALAGAVASDHRGRGTAGLEDSTLADALDSVRRMRRALAITWVAGAFLFMFVISAGMYGAFHPRHTEGIPAQAADDAKIPGSADAPIISEPQAARSTNVDEPSTAGASAPEPASGAAERQVSPVEEKQEGPVLPVNDRSKARERNASASHGAPKQTQAADRKQSSAARSAQPSPDNDESREAISDIERKAAEAARSGLESAKQGLDAMGWLTEK